MKNSKNNDYNTKKTNAKIEKDYDDIMASQKKMPYTSKNSKTTVKTTTAKYAKPVSKPAPKPIKPAKHSKKLTPFAKFVITILTTIIFFILGGVVVLFAFSQSIGTIFSDNVKNVAKSIESNLKGTNGNNSGNIITNIFSEVPEHTNFAIFGFDRDGDRTDVIMVGTFNSKNNEAALISVPRDTYTVMSSDKRGILNEAGLWTPSNGEMKINAVTHYAGKEYAIPFVVKQLEELMNIKIEYYISIDLDAFRFIVDEIGGVVFDVPQRMYYNDPEQNLYIDLHPGEQVLSGSDAEGLVRYRKADQDNPISAGYADADLQRVKVQQAFVKALINQLLQKETLISNIPAFYEIASKYIETNFSISDLGKYTKYALGFKASGISSYTLPGYIKTINGTSYYYADTSAVEEIVDELFNNPASGNTLASESQEPEKIYESSVGKSIQVLNGGFVTGLAASVRETLNEAGFNVISIGDYKGAKAEYTQIIVGNNETGGDLLPYFKDAKIVVDTSANSNYDIVIVLGTKE